MYLLTGFLILAIVVSWGRYCRLNHRVSPSSLPKIKLYFQVRENLSDIQRSDYIQSSKNKGCSYDARILCQDSIDGVLLVAASDDFDSPTTAIGNVSCILLNYLALKCLIKRSSNTAMVKTRKGV